MIIGLTGNMGSGKTTIAKYLETLGAYVIYADKIGKEVEETDEKVIEQIRKICGDDFFDASGKLKRKELGTLIFTDPEKKLQVEDIVHPIVFRKINEEINNVQKENPNRIIIVESALLLDVESTGDVKFDLIWFVAANVFARMMRIEKRDGISQIEARLRILGQVPQEHKMPEADKVFFNEDGEEENTLLEVKKAYDALLN